jgi:glycosyltransferase involved in cell wall biosynthesis
MPGFIYDKDLLRELWCNCYAYIHGNEVGGTNPALLQSMAAGCFIIAKNVSFNNDVLEDCGHYFDKNPVSLADEMNWALYNPELLQPYKKKARARIKEHYSWDLMADKYEYLFLQLVNNVF